MTRSRLVPPEPPGRDPVDHSFRVTLRFRNTKKLLPLWQRANAKKAILHERAMVVSEALAFLRRSGYAPRDDDAAKLAKLFDDLTQEVQA